MNFQSFALNVEIADWVATLEPNNWLKKAYMKRLEKV